MYDESQLVLFMFMLMRMTGFVVFSPIFGRKGIPNLVKAGFIFTLTVSVYYFLPVVDFRLPVSALDIMVRMIFELGVGYAIAVIIQSFFHVVMQTGSQIDNQMGLSMSENYDPSMAASMTITGTFLNIMLMLMFFIEGGHITLLRIIMNSGQIVPFGSVSLGEATSQYIVDTFVSCAVLAVKLSLPILAASLIGQLGMGILMKVIPQINVFAINIELKIILGLALLMLMIFPMSEFILVMEKQLLVSIEGVIRTIST